MPGTMHDDSPGLLAELTNIADKGGLTTTVDKPPLWASSDPTIATVTATADGLQATVAPAAPAKLGTVAISAVITNDDGTSVTVSDNVSVIAGEVASAALAFTPIAPTPPAA